MMTKNLEPLFKLDTYQREAKHQSVFYQQDILSVNQFTKDDMDYIFHRADEMLEMSPAPVPARPLSPRWCAWAAG